MSGEERGELELLRRQIRAKQRTIEALVDVVESRGIEAHSSIQMWSRMVQLDRVVSEKTRKLEAALAQNTRLLAAQRESERLLAEERALLGEILDAIPFQVFWKDRESRYLGCNHAFAEDAGLASPDAVVGLTDFDLPWPEGASEGYCAEDGAVMSSRQPTLHAQVVRESSEGCTRYLDKSMIPFFDDDGETAGVIGVLVDMTEQKALEAQLAQVNKLESIGQLAAGIAHEINTPTQYIRDNTHFLQESFQDLAPALGRARELARAVQGGAAAGEQAGALLDALEGLELDFLAEELPRAIEQSLEGLARVSTIVGAMKDFSHPGREGKTRVDLNRALESTVTVATTEWKYVADVETDLDPDLPPVPCLPGELNQVFLNILVNATHAIADVVGDGADRKGTIRIATRLDGDHAEVRIADTGPGIPAPVQAKVFDPFFTTKDVGKGTGQGLSIAHDVVVRKHGGTLAFETAPGEGTTFVVRLPLADCPPAGQSAA